MHTFATLLDVVLPATVLELPREECFQPLPLSTGVQLCAIKTEQESVSQQGETQHRLSHQPEYASSLPS